MLVASHAFFSTLESPFSAASWALTSNSTFGLDNVNSVAASSSQEYVAVGNSGKIAISTDSGFSWTQVQTPFLESNIYSVFYADGKYVAGGSAGKVATSLDGINWTLHASGLGASPILALNYFTPAGLWIAAGGSGKLATSSDGENWVLRSSSFSITFINSVTSNNNLAVAVGYDGKLATSADGINWTQRTSSFIFDPIFDIAFNPVTNTYVAVGANGKAAASSDALNWVQVFPGTSFGSASINTVASTGDFFVAGGALGRIATTTTGISWIQRQSNLGQSTINKIYATENSAVAVADEGKIAYSL